jgi:large subunit ribosomal protein L22
MQAQASARYVRISPFKMRRVLKLIKGKPVNEALDALHYIPQQARIPIEKAVQSAVANLGNIEEGQRLDLHEIYIKSASVDQGPTLKRFRPMSMGRAGRIRKRTSHLIVVIEDNK